ncbi:hypothetical protein MEP402_gp38 [Methylophilales phage MEP402]|nr:hypothetical protein MEP402_gp38 [Methylophilales phage MEP402]
MANFILDALRKRVTNSLIKKQSKKTRAPGSAKFKPTNTSISPASLMKGKKIYKPNQIGTPEPYAVSDAHSSNTQKKGAKLKQAYKDDAKNKNLSPYTVQKKNPNAVPGRKAITKTRTGPGRVTEYRKDGYTLNYKDGPNYKSKKKQTQAPKKKSNKRFRAGPTMTSMGGMRQSGTLRGKYVK